MVLWGTEKEWSAVGDCRVPRGTRSSAAWILGCNFEYWDSSDTVRCFRIVLVTAGYCRTAEGVRGGNVGYQGEPVVLQGTGRYWRSLRGPEGY